MDFFDIAHQLGKNKINLSKIKPKNKIKKIISTTGINQLYKVADKEDMITLAISSAKKLRTNIKDANAILLVTETPKYNIPPNSFLVHEKLKIQKNCMVFDINHGCSGYVYALSIAKGLFYSQKFQKILLITSDNYSIYCKKLNVSMLFSDCATATLLKNNKKKSFFEFYSNSSLHDKLRQKENNFERSIKENELIMNGIDVFNFSIDTVPSQILKFMRKKKISVSKVDYFLFHQASKIVIENILRKLNINPSKTILNYNKFGNTVSSSLPLIMSNSKKLLKNKKIVLCGFGVGLSVGVGYVET